MESARFWRTAVDIVSTDGKVGFRASGAVVEFPGFLKLYEEGRDEKPEDDEDRRLPKVEAAEALEPGPVGPESHFNEPPPIYSEATLVTQLAELGIGRPWNSATTPPRQRTARRHGGKGGHRRRKERGA